MADHHKYKLTARELVEMCLQAGWSMRVRGGHAILTAPDGTVVVVKTPGHGRKQLMESAARAAERAGLDLDRRRR